MSFRKINLPGNVIAGLYPNVLTAIKSPGQPEEKKEMVKFLGENKRNVLIITRSAEAIFLPDHEFQFLVKILSACKLSLADISLINLERQPLDIEKLRIELNPENMILFGIETAELSLPIDFPDFKLQQYAGCTYLKVPDISIFYEEKEPGLPLKKNLWQCLQEMFLK